jgi:hypothetical protein
LISPAVVTDGSVAQRHAIGKVGDEDAAYPHLDFEFRNGSYKRIASAHPLSYLPHLDTANFHPPNDVRFNRRLQGGTPPLRIPPPASQTPSERHLIVLARRQSHRSAQRVVVAESAMSG